jgi:hypothetical protein
LLFRAVVKTGTTFTLYIAKLAMFKEKKFHNIENGDVPYTFIDEVTKEKIKRHISDINDVISENDIKNAKIPGIENSGHLHAESTLKGNVTESNPLHPGMM